MTTKSAFNEDKVALLLGCIIFILGGKNRHVGR